MQSFILRKGDVFMKNKTKIGEVLQILILIPVVLMVLSFIFFRKIPLDAKYVYCYFTYYGHNNNSNNDSDNGQEDGGYTVLTIYSDYVIIKYDYHIEYTEEGTILILENMYTNGRKLNSKYSDGGYNFSLKIYEKIDSYEIK